MYSKGNGSVELEVKHLIIHHKGSSAKSHRGGIKSSWDPKKNRKENRGLLKTGRFLILVWLTKNEEISYLKKKKIETEYTLSSTQSHIEKKLNKIHRHKIVDQHM